MQTQQGVIITTIKMHYFLIMLVLLPSILTAPLTKISFSSSVTGNNIDNRQLPGLPDNSHLPAPRPLQLPYGHQNCPNGILMQLNWQSGGPPRRSMLTNALNSTQQTLSSTPNAILPRQAGPTKTSPLCSMIAHFTFANMNKRAATTIPIKLYPGLLYVFSVGCDVGLGSVTTWSKNRDDSDPLSDWSVLKAQDYHHHTAGTMNLAVQETTEVEFSVGFTFFGATGEIGLFQVNVG